MHGRRNAMRIQFEFNGVTLRGTLDQSAPARDFASLLPLNLTLEDYNKTEKISYLPRKLDISGVPEGVTPSVGDICYYSPWGNLAVFYKSFGYSKGLVRLGVLDDDVAALKKGDRFSAKVELINE